MINKSFDYAIVGGGIIGLSSARALLERKPQARICIIEKEPDVALHASGRNSGVLHAGFYYSADSLKAKFTKSGNDKLRAYCKDNKLPLLECGKLVVAKTSEEARVVEELYQRGKKNGVDLEIVDPHQAEKLEPLAKTTDLALFSPRTASVSPVHICQRLREELKSQGVEFFFDTEFQSYRYPSLQTTAGGLEVGFLINCAGLYADKVAHSLGVGKDFTMMPFKGVYLYPTDVNLPLKMHVYPVPNLANPFLGVHFTITVNGQVKIGPTAAPAFWREQYRFLDRLKISEVWENGIYLTRLFKNNPFDFRTLAREETKKFSMNYLRKEAVKLLKAETSLPATCWGKPGIRAQLVNKHTLQLVKDFVIEREKHSLHVLNAVSPAFTCAFSMAESVVAELSS